MGQVRANLEKAGSNIASAASEAEKLGAAKLEEAGESVSESLKTIADKATSMAIAASDNISEQATRFVAEGNKALEKLEDQVVAKPISSSLLAVGAGMLLGAGMAAVFNRRNHQRA